MPTQIEKPPQVVETLPLGRLGAWGAAAILSLLIAIFAMTSHGGSQRMASAIQPSAQALRIPPSQLAAENDKLEFETRRLSEAVRSLANDRDRLLARVTVLERNLEDVTGSFRRDTPQPAPTVPAPFPENGPSVAATVAAPIPLRRLPDPPSNRVADTHAAAFGNMPPSGSTAVRTEFGIDLGGGGDLAAIRQIWTAARSNHAALLEGLHPLIAVRDGEKPGSVELRLIAGPFANAAAAARLCASLTAAGWACNPAPFDGQRLAQQ